MSSSVWRHPFGATAEGMDGKSGGKWEFVPTLAKAAIAMGIAGLFMEVHPE